jgi:hypothetical protein
MKLVQLPTELKAILAGFVAMLVTEGLKALGDVLHIDLSGKVAAVTAAIVAAIVFFLDALLAKIPPEFEGVASALLFLLVTVLSAYGIHRQLVRFGGNVL